MSNNQIKSLTIDGITYDIVDETSGFSKISIDRKTTSGTNIADITIDGTTTELYAPTGGGGTGTVTSVGVSNATNGGLSISGSPITSSGSITIGHSNSVTAGTIGPTSITSGPTVSIPYATYDSNGHITGKGTHTHTITGFLTEETDPIFRDSVAYYISHSDVDNWNGKLNASRFVFEQNVQLDGGSNSLSASTSWTQPYTASEKIITVPAGKYIVTVSARYSGLTSGNQYGVGIAYNTGSGWSTYTRGRQLIRVYGTVVHQFSGASTCAFNSQATLTVSTYHQAAATLTDCVIGVIGLADV